MIPQVLAVVAFADQRLQLQFDTDEVRVFDLRPYLGLGRFRLLADQAVFRRARVAFGTVEWPQGLDLDPEDLYAQSVPLGNSDR